MSPLYGRCGDIVWQCKRKTHSFAFSCIYCKHQTTVFKVFKMHLLKEHSLQMQLDTEPELCGKREQQSNLGKSYDCIDAITSQRETKAAPQLEQLEDPLKNDINDEPTTDLESEPEVKSDPLLTSCGKNDSMASLESVTEEISTAHGDVSYFWLHQHPIMLSLIEHVKDERLLWDTGMLEYRNYKRRREACIRIAHQLNGKFALRFNCQDITELIKRLRTAYSVERRRLENNVYTAQAEWYYEHLSFLYKSSRRKRRFNLAQQIKSNYDTSLPVPQLTSAQNLKFIELYQRCNRLWDMQDLTCRLRHVRASAGEMLLMSCRSELQLQLEPSQLQSYIKHLRKAYALEKMRRLKCKRKRQKYTPRCRYLSHLQFLDGHMPPFQCEQCGQMLNSVDRYKMHCAEHDGSLPFVCPVCKRGFARSDNCTIHLRRHTQDFQLSCDICDKGFPNTTDLQVHRRKHTGEKPYCCDICGHRFSTCSFFDRHRRRHEQRPQGKCHLCGKTFYEKSVLKDHIKGHLNVRDKECDICHKTFTSSKYLRQHKEIHAPHKRYICKICGKGFAQYAGLSGHMKSHGTKVCGDVQEDSIYKYDKTT